MSGIRKVEKPLIFAVFNSPLVFFTIFPFRLLFVQHMTPDYFSLLDYIGHV